MPLAVPAVCLVTSGALTAADGDAAEALLSRLQQAAAAGVNMIQLREPRLSDAGLFTLAERAVRGAAGSGAAVVVNGRPDVAIAARAHGVHLRADAMPASRVRAVAPGEFLIGRSVHSTGEAIDAERDGAVDYVIFGTVFASRSKPPGHPVAGVAGLRDVCARVRVPVIAIGGINAERAAGVAAAGASGVAAIDLFAGESGAGLDALVQQLREPFDSRSRLV
jgi:thiamine-phosphate pyrophosphorylase